MLADVLAEISPIEHVAKVMAPVLILAGDNDPRCPLPQVLNYVRRLEEELQRHFSRPLLIGSFSAASNVTGILTDTERISSLLHSYGALSFWDYAAATWYFGFFSTKSFTTWATSSLSRPV